MKSPVYAEVTQTMIENLNKLKQEQLRQSIFQLISLLLFKPIQILMVLKEVLLNPCLLTCLVLKLAFSLMMDQHGVEIREHFYFEDNDKRQHQTSVYRVDLQSTSDDLVVAKTAQKLSSSSVRMPLSYRNHKQTAENQNQQSQKKINEKYFF